MSKKVRRVRYQLDANGIKSLLDEEIKLILRGADDLIMSGGRGMLAKILSGSTDKKLLELELNQSPVYGAFKGTTQKEILAKIDWLILHDYMDMEYDYRLPLLVYTDKGWKIERDTYAGELLQKLIDADANEVQALVESLKDRNRGMIILLLDKIAASGNKALIPALEAWEKIDYKKVRVKIRSVINTLEQSRK